MAITDRTRKLLWARSGNRCAICRTFLVIDGAREGEAALVGEECHIVSQSPLGPRGGSERPDDIDGCYNLILLCATHHTMVDNLPEEYTADRLRTIKKAHENWLASIEAQEATSRGKVLEGTLTADGAATSTTFILDGVTAGAQISLHPLTPEAAALIGKC